jgi:hypothetical protein
MNPLYKDFINGNLISKNDILKIVNENNINCKILNIKYSNFKKIYIEIEEKKELYFLKLSLDKYSISLSNNEQHAYSIIKESYKDRFNLIDYKMINRNEDYHLSKMKFIKGIKGNYFQYKNFYNYNSFQNLSYVSLETYLNKIKKRYNLNQHFFLKDELINKKFVTKYKNIKIPIDVSHGDFIHFNTLKSNENKYVIDLEFFNEERIFLYDFFHWYLTPIIVKTKDINRLFDFSDNVFLVIIKILNLNLRKNVNNYKEIFKNKYLLKILIVLFLFERHIFTTNTLLLKNINELVDEKHKISLIKQIDVISNLLIGLTKMR